VEATGRLQGAPNALYGLVCRASTPTDYYYFLIQGNGNYFIGRNGEQGPLNLDVGFSPAVATGRAPNRIAAECVDGPDGVTLRLFVNGVAVNTVVDLGDPIPAGGAGFRAESRRGDMSVAFDDFVVSAPAAR
jgi:hypothetical protein